MTDPYQLIRNAKFFSGLSEIACKRLAELSCRRTIAKRDLLFMEGAEVRRSICLPLEMSNWLKQMWTDVKPSSKLSRRANCSPK